MENQQVEQAFVSMNNILKDMAGNLNSELQETKNAEDYQKLMNVLEAQKIILTIESENIGFIKRNNDKNKNVSLQDFIDQANEEANNENEETNEEAKNKTNDEINEPEKANKKSTRNKNKNNKNARNKNKNVSKNKKSKYDDDKYLVDIRESHSLQEDFRHKRPHSFRFRRHYVKVSTWRELLIETCKYLYEVDPEKFKSFAEDKSMQWGETYNFSTDKTKIRGPFLIGDSGVYIETIKDSIAVRQMIIKMLNKYELKVENFKVYLKADYSK